MKNLICFVIMMLISLSAYATTLVVNQFNGPYYTINAAYNAAVDGDTILIHPATYLESVYISKAITLEGVDQNSTIIQTNSSYAIKINNGNVTISNLKIVCTNEGIEVNASTPIIKNCIIENCDRGIYTEERNFDVSNCIIKNCNKGIYYYGDSSGNVSGKLTNNIFVNCTVIAIQFYHSTYYSLSASVDIYSNIIIGVGTGIHKGSGVSYTGTTAYNCFYNNTTNTSGISLGPDNIYQNPLFFDLDTSNFYLQSTSPCIDTGNPAIEYNDLDGTRNDMGIFGGPDQWGAGAPTVMDITITPESVTPGETFDIEANGQVK